MCKSLAKTIKKEIAFCLLSNTRHYLTLPDDFIGAALHFAQKMSLACGVLKSSINFRKFHQLARSMVS